MATLSLCLVLFAAFAAAKMHQEPKKTKSIQPHDEHALKNTSNLHIEKKHVQTECVSNLINIMQNSSEQESAKKCEHEGKFMDSVIGSLQKGREADAHAPLEKLFEKCAHFSKDCAADAVPQMIEMIRFSGAAVTKTCREEVKKAQQDDKRMNATEQCDKKNKLSEQTLGGLNGGNLSLAISTTQHGLVECMKISEACAFQTAPVFMNAAVMMAMQQEAQREMEELMRSHPVIVVQPVMVVGARMVKEPPHSLLQLALSSVMATPKHAMRGAKAPALLQENTQKGRWVSGLLLQLALKKHN